MKALAALVVLVATAASPILAAAQSYPDREDTKEFEADSAITRAIASKLASDKRARFDGIRVATDKNGVVWLSGAANNQEEIDDAVNLAHTAADVRAVQSGIRLYSRD